MSALRTSPGRKPNDQDHLAAAACASHQPGDPQHGWVNGTWHGKGGRYDRTFRMEVVDGNKVIGEMTNCGLASGRCGSGPLNGSVTGGKINVTGDMSSGSYTFTLTRRDDGNLITHHGILLKKQ